MKWPRSSPPLELPEPPSYRYGLPQCFLLAVLFIVLAPVVWHETQIRAASIGESYENAGIYQYTFPVLDYTFERLGSGSLPLWNPRQLCGAPLLADSRTGVFQPLNLPFLFLPTQDALAMNAFLGVFLSGTFFAIFARATGTGYLAAAFGGMVYALSGLSAIAMSSPQLAAAMAWTPLLFWAIREYAHRFDAATAIIVGVAGALLILSGAHAYTLAAGGAAAIYAMQALLFTNQSAVRLRQRALGLGLMAFIAVGASAIQWIPTMLWMMQLESPIAYLWNLPVEVSVPESAVDLVVAVFASEPGGSPRFAYLGIIPIAIAPAALFHRHRRRDAIVFAVIAGACATAAVLWGSRLPFGFPLAALMLPALLSVSLLASIAIDRVFVPRRTFRSPSIWFQSLLVLCCAGILFYAFGAEVRRYLIPLAAALLVFTPLRLRGLAPICIAVLGAVLLIDVTHANRTAFTHPRQDAPGVYATYAQAIASARDQSLGGRVLLSSRELDRGLMGSSGMLLGYNAIGAVDYPLTEAQAAWWDRMAGSTSGLARASGKDITPKSPAPILIRYTAARVLVASPQGAMFDGRWETVGPRLREVTASGDARVYIVDDALPRAYWTPRALVEVGMPATLDALTNPAFDSTQVCVVDALSPGISAVANTSRTASIEPGAAPATATCSVEDISPERIVLRVDAPQEGIAVLADSYAPGWVATLDGERQPILKVNGLFRGIATPPGAHVIEFQYRPWSVYAGMTVSIATLGLAVVLGLRSIVRPGALRALGF
ncbi:MAG TPA: YfhO family protein [Candidatus Hydrogenedentes bacterium]|nr:YfhO family protein [Candidatus Hydrogenedentota bacterium]HRK34269.1 YfhO family protein [Candidatus Hydrogenedentota bacterium]